MNPPRITSEEDPWGVLRARAEAVLGSGAGPGDRAAAAEIDRLIHELQVHQIELELQNEELRRAQEELLASRDRYADLYDFSPIAYFTVGRKGLIEEANLTAATLLGVERGALVGTLFSAHVASAREDQDAYYRHRKDVLATGDRLACELRLLTGDGRSVHAQLESVAVAAADGKADTLRMAAIDVSERKRAEEALREARDAAQAADRAKTEFLTNMSHEVRTPLSGVLGMVEVLSGTPLSPEQWECVEDIRLSGRMLLGIVNDLLDLARMESRGVALESVEFALRNAIEDTVHLHAEAGHAKGLELCCLLGPEVPARVMGDPGRLRQVLSNLVGNAVKFTGGGRVVVRAELWEQRNGAPVIRVAVEDTGIGISEDLQERIFENFSQADPSSSRRYGGSGLGLPICRQLVRAMGGEIGFRSTHGQGSAFWFTVPFAEAVPAPAAPAFEGVQALVVEHHPTSRAFLLEQLARLGVVASATGDRAAGLHLAAQAAAEGRPYRLALVDVELPGGGGMNLVRALETHRGPAGLGAILLASFTAQGLAREGGAQGRSCHVVKPVRERELIRCIEEVLSGGDPPQRATRGIGPSAAAQRGRVLLAEDTPVNQKVMVELLQRQGYRTDVVEDGAAAVAAALARPYDLVIMDWQMPGMDGLEATREIRRTQGPNQRTPIVAMTAHALETHRPVCIEAGMDDYLHKPVEPGDLSRVLERWAAGTEQAAVGGNEPAAADGLEVVRRRIAEFRERFPPETAEKLVETILENWPQGLAELRSAAANADARELSQRAHALRGTYTVVGADRVCGLLQTLERQGERGDLGGVDALLDEVEEELERIGAILAAARPDGRGGGP